MRRHRLVTNDTPVTRVILTDLKPSKIDITYRVLTERELVDQGVRIWGPGEKPLIHSLNKDIRDRERIKVVAERAIYKRLSKDKDWSQYELVNTFLDNPMPSWGEVVFQGVRLKSI